MEGDSFAGERSPPDADEIFAVMLYNIHVIVSFRFNMVITLS